MYVWGIKLQMSLSRCSFVDFVTSYATDQPIFAGRPVNRTKILQGESQHCHCKRSYVRAKSGCVNDGYPGFTRRIHRSFLTTYADRALFLRVWNISLCTHVVHNDMQSAVRSGKKTDKYFRSPNFPIKGDKFILIDSKQYYYSAFDVVRYPIQYIYILKSKQNVELTCLILFNA